ncbi:uncharacterized protein LOC133314527 [Gastrolobium bilobum]|uniref:uncharacterized protein LOC133314527 n=1 Tax=Gastrolobium bilobum TaxID=150636 RepID=UPI002AB2D188|nr:uncharacterized protein LOC133314527 [Gastrolobium bilobum]
MVRATRSGLRQPSTSDPGNLQVPHPIREDLEEQEQQMPQIPDPEAVHVSDLHSDSASTPAVNPDAPYVQGLQPIDDPNAVAPDPQVTDLAMAAVLRRMEELEQRNELQRQADARQIRELEARLWWVTNPDPERAITQVMTDLQITNPRQDNQEQTRRLARTNAGRPLQMAANPGSNQQQRQPLGRGNPGHHQQPRHEEMQSTHDEIRLAERKYNRGQYNDSPFAYEILEAPYPENLNLSELIKYDGTQDPQVHLDAFDTAMYIKGIEEPLIMRLFATTLTGAAQAWFLSLPAGSIRSFEEFGGRFLLNFATSKKQPKSEFALGKIKKQPGEMLQKYLDRFKLAALQIEVENVDQKHQPGHGEKLGGRRANELRGKRQDDRFQLRGRFDKYAPLNSPRSQIWREVASTDMKKVERPRPLQNPAGLDHSRYCAFHDRSGHTTDECWDLKDAIERYVREGKLRQYLIRTQGWRNRKRRGCQLMSPTKDKKFRVEGRGKKPAREDDEFQEPKFKCNVISGAFGGGGDTMNARRKYLRVVLSIRECLKFKEEETESPLLYFTKKELEDVMPGHVDGLVITGTLVNCRVKKIFLDNGSCADIILWHAFKKMNLDEEDLKPCNTALIA